jgi:hypothetical protein
MYVLIYVLLKKLDGKDKCGVHYSDCHFSDQRALFSQKHVISYLLPKKRENSCGCNLISR